MHQRLQQRLQAARKADGGFTLIELLIVIVILGVLAGVVVFSVQFVNDRGNKAACRTDVKNVETAVEGYYAQNGKFPNLLDDLKPTYLNSLPNSTTYTVAYDNTTGTVSSTYCP